MRARWTGNIPATHFRLTAQRLEDMRAAIYYLLMLLLGFAWYKFGQNLLLKKRWGENGERTEGLVGPVGLLVTTGVVCYLLFEFLRGLVRGEVPCVGKACRMQVYTLAADAGDYWANMFFLAWMVLGQSYAAYVTLKIWFRA